MGPRIGPITTAGGEPIDADASMENEPGFLFDALVLPDGDDAVEGLSLDGHTMEFIKDQYRHGKTILKLGASQKLLNITGISNVLPSGDADPSVLVEATGAAVDMSRFIAAIGQHRHAVRETDPPLV